MTPEQLREWANAIEGEKPWAPKVADVCDQLRAHAAALEEIERLKEAVELMYDKWENGDNCHEVDGEDMGAFLGKAFRLSKEEEDAILALLKGIPTPSPMQIATQRAEKAERRAERLNAAIRWALGYEDWPERGIGEGPFYWREELRRRADKGE